MKKLILAVAAVSMFLAASALPSMADGNPMSKCSVVNCPS